MPRSNRSPWPQAPQSPTAPRSSSGPTTLAFRGSRTRHGEPDLELATSEFRLRLANGTSDRNAALRLRFEVFNLELGEGLETSYSTGRDEDAFDEQCDHLLVEDRATGEVVGTYRLQTAQAARAARGFYTATEFDLSYLPTSVLEHGVELGRACVARRHRGTSVLMLLWRGIAEYARVRDKRYFFGCCSLPSRDPLDGWLALDELERRGALWNEAWVPGRPGRTCALASGQTHRGDRGGRRLDKLPPLFESYLRYGGRVCSPPVLDREFGTIDFLVVFDVEAMAPRTRDFFFARGSRAS